MAVSGVAVVSDRSEWTEAFRAQYRTDVIRNRGPGITGMKLINSIQLPASNNLGQEAVTLVEVRQVPNRVCTEIMSGIVVRGAPLGAIIDGIGLVGGEARPLPRNLVDRFAPRVKYIRRNPVPK